ncbi:HAD family hydrolase [Myroides sp. LJL115]
MKKDIHIIAFDADDTLWVNEPYFQEAERQFCALLESYQPPSIISQELFNTEMKNLHLYGYGVKGFVLCMIETANIVSNTSVSSSIIAKIIEIGNQLLQKPIVLLQGVEETLESLHKNYKLVLATKGDLLDQKRKLHNSGLEHYFDHIEIMSEKKQSDYKQLLSQLDGKAENLLMLGNSLKSDIIPILELGGYAAHIPYHVTWAHEEGQSELEHKKLLQLKSVDQILKYLL